MKKIYIFWSLILVCYSQKVLAIHVTSIKGTISAIERPINDIVVKAENLFEVHGGQPHGDSKNMIGGDNPFITSFTIESDYKIRIQLAGTLGTSADNVPVNPRLRGAKILLVPVFTDGDNYINSWACITDADAGSKEFMGTNSNASEGNISFIAAPDISDENPYLSSCSYKNNPF